MGYNFTNVVSPLDIHNTLLQHFGANLTPEEQKRLKDIKQKWNFYEGYHWQEIPDTGKPQVTENYCRAFVNKFIAYELGKGFKIKMKPDIEKIDDENDPLVFLNKVWDHNNKEKFCIEFAQSKAVTGDAWVQVAFEPKFINGQRNPEFIDPFDEFEKGKIRIIVVPTAVCFPEYSDGYDKDRLIRLTIMYPVQREDKTLITRREKFRTVLYKQIWTDSMVEVWEGNDLKLRIPNKYGVIPFVQVKNIPIQGKTYGMSDLDDIIPLNMELNLKLSDVSEIIDYHSAPITLVFGTRVGSLERGANKVWGGLPKDARVENLKLEGDLSAANAYIDNIKNAIHEIGSVPKGALGGDLKISNTSGVALQIALSPLLERIQMKRASTKAGLELINKLILHIALKEGLLFIPEKVKREDYFYNEVHFESVLPKDEMQLLQTIEVEMRLGLENREGAMERLGKADIQEKIQKIDEDRRKNPTIYGLDPNTMLPDESEPKPGENADGQPKKVNAGFNNGPEPKPEILR